MKNLIFIHGAWSTFTSFTHIISELNRYGHKSNCLIQSISYDAHKTKLAEVVEHTRVIIQKSHYNVILIGHSLGGLVALAASNEDKCEGVVTLAAPLSGISIPILYRGFLYDRAPILREVAPDSSFIRDLHEKSYSIPIDVLITTKGFNPAITQPSDGIVTIESQKRWIPSTAAYRSIDCNHYEILQRPEVVQTIRNKLE